MWGIIESAEYVKNENGGIFSKYRIRRYVVGNESAWGISERFLLFFYKPLIHWKSVNISSSREILLFPTLETAEDELDILYMGGTPVIGRLFENGVLTHEKRRGGEWQQI